MSEVRLEGCIYGPGSNKTLNRRDVRSKFRYTRYVKYRLDSL